VKPLGPRARRRGIVGAGTLAVMSRARRIARLALAWVPAVLTVAVIFWWSAQPGHAFLPDPVLDVAVKKIGHFLGYAILGVALALAIDWSVASAAGRGSGRAAHRGSGRTAVRAPLSPGALLWAWAIAAAYAVTDEAHQVLVPARTPSVLDVAIDAAGAAAGLAVLVWWRARRREDRGEDPGTR